MRISQIAKFIFWKMFVRPFFIVKVVHDDEGKGEVNRLCGEVYMREGYLREAQLNEDGTYWDEYDKISSYIGIYSRIKHKYIGMIRVIPGNKELTLPFFKQNPELKNTYDQYICVEPSKLVIHQDFRSRNHFFIKDIFSLILKLDSIKNATYLLFVGSYKTVRLIEDYGIKLEYRGKEIGWEKNEAIRVVPIILKIDELKNKI